MNDQHLQLEETENEQARTPESEPIKVVHTPEGETLAKNLVKVADALSADAPLRAEVLAEVARAFGEITFEFLGEELTLAELYAIPDLDQLKKIYEEIQQGNLENKHKLRYLPSQIAQILISEYLQKEGNLIYLTNITSLSDKALELLLNCGAGFTLGLTSLSDTTAMRMAHHKHAIVLNYLTSLSDTAAEHLATHQGPLMLNGLTSLSDVAVEYLAKNQGALYLNGLTSLSDTAAKHLSMHEGRLELYGITSLSDKAAEYFGAHEGPLSLPGLTSLSDTAAEHLVKHKGRIGLSGLKTFSLKAFALLRKHPDIEFPYHLQST